MLYIHKIKTSTKSQISVEKSAQKFKQEEAWLKPYTDVNTQLKKCKKIF